MIKNNTKIPRFSDEGWHSQNQPSGPVENKRKRNLTVSSSKVLEVYPKSH